MRFWEAASIAEQICIKGNSVHKMRSIRSSDSVLAQAPATASPIPIQKAGSQSAGCAIRFFSASSNSRSCFRSSNNVTPF